MSHLPIETSGMAAQADAFDWAKTELGPLTRWPERVRGVVELVLASPLVASIAIGPKRRLVYNDAAAALYGDRHPAILGQPLMDAFPDSYPSVAAFYDRVFAGEAVRVAAQPLALARQGEVFDAYLTPVRDPAGTVVGAHMVGLEIGERVRAEAALRDREALLMRVQRIGQVGGLDIDVADGLTSHRSPEYLRLHGLGPESAHELHADWRARVHPDDADEAERRLLEALAGTATSYDSEYRIVRPTDGAIRWIHARADIERDAAGMAKRLVGAHLDVTDQKRMHEALRASETRQAFLLKLSDALRPLAEADVIARTACRILVEHVKASRAQFTEVTGAVGSEMGEGLAEYVETGAPMPRRYRLSAFGEPIVAELRAGRSLILNDTAIDARLSEPERRAFGDVEALAAIAIPLVKQGRLVATFAVHDARPRLWTDSEVAFVEDVAERTWAAIERARAEAAVRDSEATLAAAFDSVPVGMAIIDLDGRAIRSNAEYRRFLPGGIIPSRDPLDSRRWRGWDAGGSPVDASLFPGARALRGDTVIPGQEMLFTDDDGREIWTAVATAPVRDGGGDVSGAVSVIADIDVAKRSGDLLRESEERHRALFESMDEAYAVVEVLKDAAGAWADFRFVATNPAFMVHTGMPYPVGRTATELLGSPNPRWTALYGQALDTGEMLRVEESEEALGIVFDLNIFALDRVQNRVAVLFTNITERKRAEVALRESERRLQTLIEGVPQLVWRASDPGIWTWASPQWTDFTGQAEPASHRWGWLDRVHPEDRNRVRGIWSDAIDHGRFEADYRICHAVEDRYRWFQTRATPVRDEHGRITEWLGTSTDVDDLLRLQERQHVLVAELQHRTRNLMGVVRSTANRMGETSANFADFRHRFNDRLEALARVQGLLSRLNEADRISFDELLRTEIAAMHGLGHGSGQEAGDRVTLDGPPGIRLRSGMVQTLAMAIHELATNAVKYGALGQAGGRLRVHWRMVEPDRRGRPRLRIEWQESGVAMPPPEATAQGGGQGRELIERALPYQLGAETSFELGRDGVRCTITIPVSVAAPEMAVG